MSFQGYLKTIKEKTGKTPKEFKALADKKGFTKGGKLKPETKAAQIVDWLAEDFDLGRGHAMALFAIFKGIKTEDSE